jgi:hypothetical protein
MAISPFSRPTGGCRPRRFLLPRKMTCQTGILSVPATPVFRAGTVQKKKSTEDQIFGPISAAFFRQFFHSDLRQNHSKSKLLILKVVVHFVAPNRATGDNRKTRQPPPTRISALKKKKGRRRTCGFPEFAHKKKVSSTGNRRR